MSLQHSSPVVKEPFFGFALAQYEQITSILRLGSSTFITAISGCRESVNTEQSYTVSQTSVYTLKTTQKVPATSD